MKKILSAIQTVILIVVFVSLPVDAEDVSARSAILIEADSGDVIFEKNAHEKLPMASTTKIMTAITVLENADCETIVSISEKACGIEGSSIYLKPDEKLTVGQLLYAVMLESANDAAAAAAIAVSGSTEAFVDLMNDTAEKIGMCDSHFTNPHGLDDESHYTTAADLAKLTAYAMKNPVFCSIVSTKQYSIPSSDGEGFRYLSNHNRLLKMSDDVTGVKTGFTKRSGRCLVSSAERDGVSLIAVTLNAPDDWNDHLALHKLGFSSYSSVTLAGKGEYSIDIPCPCAPDGKISISNHDELTVVLKNGANIESVVESGPLVFPPIDCGDICGHIRFYSEGREIGTLPLYADESVSVTEDTRSFGEKLLDIIK